MVARRASRLSPAFDYHLRMLETPVTDLFWMMQALGLVAGLGALGMAMKFRGDVMRAVWHMNHVGHGFLRLFLLYRQPCLSTRAT